MPKEENNLENRLQKAFKGNPTREDHKVLWVKIDNLEQTTFKIVSDIGYLKGKAETQGTVLYRLVVPLLLLILSAIVGVVVKLLFMSSGFPF